MFTQGVRERRGQDILQDLELVLELALRRLCHYELIQAFVIIFSSFLALLQTDNLASVASMHCSPLEIRRTTHGRDMEHMDMDHGS